MTVDYIKFIYEVKVLFSDFEQLIFHIFLLSTLVCKLA